MSSDGSDTHRPHLLKAGNRAAAQILWERYCHLLVSCATQHLGDAPRRVKDEEDAALGAFASFCRGVEQGPFPRLEDRDDLRTVLLILVARKAAHYVRDEGALKRGGGKVRTGGEDEEVLAGLIDSEPTPELAAPLADECRRLLGKLSEDLRKIARWRTEGDADEEIAEKRGRAPSTVAHKLAEIRDIWRKERPTP